MGPIHARILNRISGLAAEAGLGIAKNCFSELYDLAETVERNIIKEPHRQAQAMQLVDQFVAAMIDEARRLNYSELHEDTFAAALLRFRFWPFR